MKLKTEVRQGDDMVVPIATGDEFDQFNAYCHDAAAAHALVKALNEHAEDFTVCWSDDPVEFAPWVFKRADEILAKWGFADGCS